MPADENDLFAAQADKNPDFTPLAQRMRPRTLEELAGQRHLLEQGRILRRAIDADRIPSMILWGPPGCGKTTLAEVIALRTGAAFEVLSAVTAGVRDVREVVARASERRKYEQRRTILFLDEIHRFNRAQQDALLPHVEAGVCVLIGATTENPSFEVNAPLLSRARVFRLRELSEDDLIAVLRRALSDAERGLGAKRLQVGDDALGLLARAAQGDARRALTSLEIAADGLEIGAEVTARAVEDALGERSVRYDRAGEEHYNVISALIKSVRASDPDAAIYWLARLLESGEDPVFVARRLVIAAAEDVANADPQALVVANAAAAAAHLVGMPEAMLPLSQATLYLALAPKSNTPLSAYRAAQLDVREFGALSVPLVVRNAATGLMKREGYGQGYRYPHDIAGNIDPDHGSYLPERLAGKRTYFEPIEHGWEGEAYRRLRAIRSALLPPEGRRASGPGRVRGAGK
jgi:putative ATPase